ncbi:hypothetical protein BH10CYA1_BH10CYA1_58410 [soil metagenome]
MVGYRLPSQDDDNCRQRLEIAIAPGEDRTTLFGFDVCGAITDRETSLIDWSLDNHTSAACKPTINCAGSRDLIGMITIVINVNERRHHTCELDRLSRTA